MEENLKRKLLVQETCSRCYRIDDLREIKRSISFPIFQWDGEVEARLVVGRPNKGNGCAPKSSLDKSKVKVADQTGERLLAAQCANIPTFCSSSADGPLAIKDPDQANNVGFDDNPMAALFNGWNPSLGGGFL